jgi:hypothetical protein
MPAPRWPAEGRKAAARQHKASVHIEGVSRDKLPRKGYRHFSFPQSSSASRLTAGAAGFLLLTQCRERPDKGRAGGGVAPLRALDLGRRQGTRGCELRKPKKRHWERAKKLMDRLGATEWGEPPLRPKNMQRRTFARLVDELWDAWLSDGSANLGVLLDRDALANLGSAEIDDIVGKRITDIDLRRRRRKSSNQ